MKKRIVVAAAGGLVATVVGDLLLSVVLNSSSLLAKVGPWAWSSVSWIWAMEHLSRPRHPHHVNVFGGRGHNDESRS